jgi:hypothetical protein
MEYEATHQIFAHVLPERSAQCRSSGEYILAPWYGTKLQCQVQTGASHQQHTCSTVFPLPRTHFNCRLAAGASLPSPQSIHSPSDIEWPTNHRAFNSVCSLLIPITRPERALYQYLYGLSGPVAAALPHHGCRKHLPLDFMLQTIDAMYDTRWLGV